MLDIRNATKEDLFCDFADLWQLSYRLDWQKLTVDNEPLMRYLDEGGFFTAPASTKYHGAYPGGLYDHSRAVYLRLDDLTEKNGLKWQRPESPFIVGMFHDLCKCDQYIKADGARINGSDTIVTGPGLFHYEYNANTLLKGHGAKSVMILSQFINLTEEEMLCIRYHMGPYEKEEWSEFDAAIRRYENVYWAHAADMLASKVDGV